ncbi:hypothetical protein K1X76_08390 [bacterium]|nr:hypothetical protein [bacterium]
MALKAQVETFPFDKLPRFTRAECEVVSFMAKYFPVSFADSALLDQLGRSLKKYFGDAFSINFENMEEIALDNLNAKIAGKCVVAAVSLTPYTKKLIITSDLDLTTAIIDKALGGGGEVPEVPGELTALEEGVLEFVAAKVLKALNGVTASPSHRFILESLETRRFKSEVLYVSTERFYVLRFLAAVNNVSGIIAVHIPLSLLFEMKGRSDIFAANENMRYQTQRLKDFDNLRTVLWGELGHVLLHPQDLNILDRGDVVLFDETDASLMDGKVKGTIKLRFGDGRGAGFEAFVEADHTSDYQVKLGSMLSKEE